MASALPSAIGQGPPGHVAVPDDQGNLGFCSRFALGKAIGNGFMERKFQPHEQIDFDQSHIVTAIVNSDEVERKIETFTRFVLLKLFNTGRSRKVAIRI